MSGQDVMKNITFEDVILASPIKDTAKERLEFVIVHIVTDVEG